jgi:hypothetical protein
MDFLRFSEETVAISLERKEKKALGTYFKDQAKM